MNPTDSVARLESFGYPPRQAAFLRLVLLFGGYFVRRQFTTFLSRGDGGLTTEFVRALVARNHATCATFRGKTQVVHVFAKRLYAALGEPDNRNRRPVEPATILRKLLTLDVVLAHRREHFLATTREKIAYFRAADIPLHAFPTTRFRARRHAGPPTDRYFVDKVPIWVSADGNCVVFAYVRTPIEGVSGLRTWLATCAPLLARLPDACLILVTTSEEEAAESVGVATTVLRATTVNTPQSVEEQRACVERYFDARRQLELGDFRQATPEDLARLRVMRARFPDTVYDPLYRAYLSWGPTALYTLPPVPTARRLTHVTVTREVIPVRYELFGTQYRRRESTRSPRRPPRIDGNDLSARSAA